MPQAGGSIAHPVLTHRIDKQETALAPVVHACSRYEGLVVNH